MGETEYVNKRSRVSLAHSLPEQETAWGEEEGAYAEAHGNKRFPETRVHSQLCPLAFII